MIYVLDFGFKDLGAFLGAIQGPRSPEGARKSGKFDHVGEMIFPQG